MREQKDPLDSESLRRLGRFISGISRVLNRTQIEQAMGDIEMGEADSFALDLAGFVLADSDFVRVLSKRVEAKELLELREKLTECRESADRAWAELRLERAAHEITRRQKIEEWLAARREAP